MFSLRSISFSTRALSSNAVYLVIASADILPPEIDECLDSCLSTMLGNYWHPSKTPSKFTTLAPTFFRTVFPPPLQ